MGVECLQIECIEGNGARYGEREEGAWLAGFLAGCKCMCRGTVRLMGHGCG